MRGLDTNVLVRYLTRDDDAQFAAASDLIEGAEHRSERLYLNIVVLCELTWVLRGSRYRFPRPPQPQGDLSFCPRSRSPI